MSEMTPDTRPLSQRMLLDGMYPGIVEKWAAEVAGLEVRIKALERYICDCGKPNDKHSNWCSLNGALRDQKAALAAKEKSMSEMFLAKLREVLEVLVANEDVYGRTQEICGEKVSQCLAAWEADIARIEELEKLASHEAHCACVPTLEARIEALERKQSELREAGDWLCSYVRGYREESAKLAVRRWEALAAKERPGNASCACVFSTATGTVDTTGCSLHGSALAAEEKEP